MSIFTGIRVLEFSPLISGQYCAKLLGDLGAEVIKVESPGDSDWTRRRGPFLNDTLHIEGSGLFLYLNTNKLGVTLDPEVPAARDIFRRLICECDVLIEGRAPGVMAELGLDYDVLKALNPRLIMASVSPFGQTGPYRDYKAYPLNLFHAGGEGFLLPGGLGFELFPDREPVKAPGYVADYDGGVAAAIAVVAALIWRGLSGRGQYIDISVQEAVLHLSRVEIERYADDRFLESRGTRFLPTGGLFQCKDGFVEVMPSGEAMWSALMHLMGDPEWAQHPDYRDRNTRMLRTAEIREKLAEWALAHDKEYIYHEGQAAGVATGAVYTAEDIFNSPQMKAREFFVELDHPHCGRLAYPSVPYRFSETPAAFRQAAPLLGQHNQEIYCGLLGFSAAEIEGLRESGAI